MRIPGRRLAPWLALCAIAVAGCSSPSSPTLATVPVASTTSTIPAVPTSAHYVGQIAQPSPLPPLPLDVSLLFNPSAAATILFTRSLTVIYQVTGGYNTGPGGFTGAIQGTLDGSPTGGTFTGTMTAILANGCVASRAYSGLLTIASLNWTPGDQLNTCGDASPLTFIVTPLGVSTPLTTSVLTTTSVSTSSTTTVPPSTSTTSTSSSTTSVTTSSTSTTTTAPPTTTSIAASTTTTVPPTTTSIATSTTTTAPTTTTSTSTSTSTTTTTVTPVTVSGTWTGSGSDGQGPFTLTWVLTQIGSGVTGTAATVSPSDGSCASCHKIKSGTISGTVSSDGVFSFTMSVPADELKVPTPADPTPKCAVTISGSTASLTSSAASVSYAGTDTCEVPFSGTITMSR